jgi:hypothetical protein
MKAEYFVCRNCDQVVQGFHASEMITCCERPDYRRLSDEEIRSGGGYVEPESAEAEVEESHHAN